MSRSHGHAFTQIRQIEKGNAVSAVSGADKKEERHVLIDRHRLSFAEPPSVRDKVEWDRLDLPDERLVTKGGVVVIWWQTGVVRKKALKRDHVTRGQGGLAIFQRNVPARDPCDRIADNRGELPCQQQERDNAKIVRGLAAEQKVSLEHC